MSEKERPTANETGGIEEKTSDVPLSRRGMLVAGGLLGAGLVGGAGNTSANHETDDGNPFAQEGHDHHGDYLGESSPVNRIDVNKIRAADISTTRYADSIAEVNKYIEEASDSGRMGEWSGVKIVLRQGEFTPSANQLPIELKSGVVIEGQGSKATVIKSTGIDKPVFKFDRSHQKIRRHVTIRDLKLLDTWIDSGSPTPGSKGIFLKNVHYWTIENVQIVGYDDGIVLPGSWTGTILNCHIDASGHDAIRLRHFENVPYGGMAPNNIQIIGTAIKRSRRYGIYGQQGRTLHIAGTDISGSGKYGILVDDVDGLFVHGCHLEFNGLDSPRADGLDRNGDGKTEPVAIGLSPESTHNNSAGLSIVGNRIGYPPDSSKVGIKLNNVDSVEITGNWNGHSNRGFVELGPLMRNVTIKNNSKFHNGGYQEGLIVGPLNGSNIPPRELNNGVWRTADFANYAELATLAKDHVTNEQANGFEVVLSEGLSGDSRVVDGDDFPPETLFRGLGSRSTTVSTTGSRSDVAVKLSKAGQRARNLRVDAEGSSIGIELRGEETGVENVSIPSAGDYAIVVHDKAVRSTIRDVICGNDVGGDVDIDVNGEGARVVSCDASIDTSDVEVALNLSVDTY